MKGRAAGWLAAAFLAVSPILALSPARRGVLAAEQMRDMALLAGLTRRPEGVDWLGGSLSDTIHRRLLIADLKERIARRSRLLAGSDSARDPAPAVSEEAGTPPDTAEPPPATTGDAALTARLAALDEPTLPPDSGPPPERPRRRKPLYRLPVEGDLVSGTGEHGPDGVRARGITLATPPGRSVLAPATGRVRYAGPFRNYGDIVILDHGHGWTTLIAGLERTSIEVGADLRGGAHVGRTTHRLLVELRHGGRPVDVVAMAEALGR